MDFQIQIQKIVFDFFSEVNDTVFLEIVDYIVFDSDQQMSSDANMLIKKFMDENGMQTAFDNYKYDLTNIQLFRKSSGSELGMIEKLRTAFLVSCRNRLYKAVEDVKSKVHKNKAAFNFLKRTALDCYESLNRSEQYFDGEKEDGKIVEKIKNTIYEN